ncbi:MAG: hypothetical protein V1678_03055 [Candidatus Aenigmatarchaeota archaeon]
MKGGIFSNTETFMKILSTGYLTVVLLGIFFAINQYHMIFIENKMDRETLNVGNTVLSSCIAENSTGYVVKGLLSEGKLIAKLNANPARDRNIDCLRFYKGIYIEIYNMNNNLLYGIGDATICVNYPLGATTPCKLNPANDYTTFPAALNTTSSGIIPVMVNISIGKSGGYSSYSATCGDGSCNNAETCSSCASDCGSCSTGGGGILYWMSDCGTDHYQVSLGSCVVHTTCDEWCTIGSESSGWYGIGCDNGAIVGSVCHCSTGSGSGCNSDWICCSS